ncbi:MAG TPA: ABC transporter permease [Phycisphaerae bacterium]|jgi:ABC-2 type transport system permease protein
MNRIWAIIERDLRRFRRSPLLIIVSMIMPLMQLLILGNAFGGRIKHMQLGVVDQDHGVPAVRLAEMFQAVAANAQTFTTVAYSDRGEAIQDLRDGRLDGVVTIPPEFSRKVLAGANPRFALIEDNTDQFSSNTLEGTLNGLLASYQVTDQPTTAPGAPAVTANVSLAVVEIYPYVPYIQFLLPGTIVLAIFVSAMIGGGIIYIDDKARGLHEGYLVTPITRLELVLGFNLAGALKAIIAGLVLITVGSLMAGVPNPLEPMRLARMMLVVVAAALALISMMSLIMVRINDPLVPRAIFGMLNTVLYFPSGAVYPTGAFPKWMQVISQVDPFTYAVHAFKILLLKNASLSAISFDLIFLFGFAAGAMALATMLFKRTL